jgi:parvulin-like peptidyl-prolyl isomerase
MCISSSAHIIRRCEIVLLLLLLISFPAIDGSETYASEPEQAASDPVVARVGDTVITETDLKEAAQRKVQNVYSHGQDLSAKPEYRLSALNELIDMELFSLAAAQRGIKMPDDVVQGVVEENIKRLGSEKALQEVLQNRKLSMDAFKARIRSVRMANELLKALYEESSYSDEELKKYYEENRKNFHRPDAVQLYDILLKMEPSAPEPEWQMKKEAAEGLLKRLMAGEDFYTIAYYNSEDDHRVKGGDLGFIHTGMLIPQELEDAAFALKPGEVSSVVRTDHGFHILKAGEKKPGELLGFDSVKEKLAKELHQKRFEEKKAAILRRMREEYPVKIYIPLENKS